mmetsp:Transcript_11928/g.24211  ORF Transcript_11928/g.24211 Transcript_11928/m.24211 type:complete len:238 (+) Transcript_11928:160-873(+)
MRQRDGREKNTQETRQATQQQDDGHLLREEGRSDGRQVRHDRLQGELAGFPARVRAPPRPPGQRQGLSLPHLPGHQPLGRGLLLFRQPQALGHRGRAPPQPVQLRGHIGDLGEPHGRPDRIRDRPPPRGGDHAPDCREVGAGFERVPLPQEDEHAEQGGAHVASHAAVARAPRPGAQPEHARSPPPQRRREHQNRPRRRGRSIPPLRGLPIQARSHRHRLEAGRPGGTVALSPVFHA